MYRLSYNASLDTANSIVEVPASKSIANRALILQAIFNWKFPSFNCNLTNLSLADDTLLMQMALHSSEKEINLKNAGTCFRFLTAYFALVGQEEKILTGTERLKQRPIAGLVNALRSLGASIVYLEKEGYAPLLIKPSKLNSLPLLYVDTEKSSQFLSAILLISAFLEKGQTFQIDRLASSFSYIQMTLHTLQSFGIQWKIEGQELHVFPVTKQPISTINYAIEADWSSAAFFYAYKAINPKAQIQIQGLQSQSIQGDSVLSEMATDLGVLSQFNQQGVQLLHSEKVVSFNKINWNFSQCPDLAPVMIMAAAICADEALFTGLDNLDYKESNRLQLLTNYLIDLGVDCTTTNHSLEFKKTKAFSDEFTANTANDHRMVMCLTLLSFSINGVYLNEIDSVEKSFPDFWRQANKLGFFY